MTNDYEPVFATNFIEHFPLPSALIPRLVSFVNNFNRYDMSRLSYADIGRIYDRLIPDNERHKLGQYFTRDDVVDVINGFCIRNPNESVADFGCGVGTFLVRAYALKMFQLPAKTHSEILNELVGLDISKFPAHLATINLMIRDLGEIRSYPQIKNEDFFDVSPAGSKPRRALEIPAIDAIVGNPPYTRQEEIEDITHEGYKERLQKVVQEDWPGIKIGKKAGIHFYFFIHGFRFLKSNGRFGYVVSNSWLDTDVGRDLQEFFLGHAKILAVIEPKTERWFEDADINTCIVVLEREDRKQERDGNVVRFVQLKRKLPELLRRTDDAVARWRSVKDLVERVGHAAAFAEDEDLRMYPIAQRELWKEGYDEDRQRYVGAKWGKYVRAPDVFFTRILPQVGKALVPLGQLSEIREGQPTGSNDFFFIPIDQQRVWGIERRFLRPAIKSPKHILGFGVKENQVRHYKLVVSQPISSLTGTSVLRYVKWGEKEGYRKDYFPEPWYSRDDWVAPLLYPRSVWDRYVCFLNETKVVVSDRFIEIVPGQARFIKAIGAFLNSTLGALLIELYGRTLLGQGLLDFQPTDLRKVPVIDPSKLDKQALERLEKAFDGLLEREEVWDIHRELGADLPDEVSPDKVDIRRRALDDVVFDILRLAHDEQLEVYSAIIDLLNSRSERAKSVNKRRTTGPDVSELAMGLVRDVPQRLLSRFPEDFLGPVGTYEINLPQGMPIIKSQIDGIYLEIDSQRIPCESKWKAQYLRFAAIHGRTKVKVPLLDRDVREAVRAYSEVFKELEQHVGQHLQDYLPDRRIRRAVQDRVWRILFMTGVRQEPATE